MPDASLSNRFVQAHLAVVQKDELPWQKKQILRCGILRGQNRAIAMWAGTNFKAAELHGMTLFNRGDLVLKDSLTPTRGAGVRGVGGGGPGWG